MNHWSALLVAFAFLAYALVSRRLAGSILTGPLLFAAFGVLIGPQGLGWITLGISNHAIQLMAEITLVVVLFTDAAGTDFKVLARERSIPLRMLLIGMPLAMAFGTLAALGLFPEWSLWEAALLAAILTPTDAALGEAVTENSTVPDDVRTAINSESGLNDGLALPMVLLFASLAAGPDQAQPLDWLHFLGLQIALGPLAGVAVGYVGAKLIAYAFDSGWMSEWAEGIAALSVALGAFLLAEAIHGNGFLAAFTGGLAFGRSLGRKCAFVYEFQQTEAHVLVLATFLIVGAMLLPEATSSFSWGGIAFAVFALTLMRMLPIAVSLAGLDLRPITVAFLGWFGPRGLASVLFVLIILERHDLPHRDALLAVVAVTVGLSIVAHGVTAAPLAKAYGRTVSGRDEN